MPPYQQYNQTPNLPPRFGQPSKGALIVAIASSSLLVVTSVIAIWAFIGMQENKSNLDAKIETASAAAVAAAETVKENEFTEREKSPFKSYTGPTTYGSVRFEYPKTWSVLVDETGSGSVPLDFYGHPNLLPGSSSSAALAFRFQVLNASYDKKVAEFNNGAKNGSVSVSAFTPTKVSGQTGVRITGQITKDRNGIMVILPLRDKVIQLWTESNDYAADFEKVLQSITYEP